MVAVRAICVLSLSVASALAFSPSTPVLRGSTSASLSAVRHRQQPLVAAGRGVGRSSAALSSLKMGFLDVLKEVSVARPLHVAVPLAAAYTLGKHGQTSGQNILTHRHASNSNPLHSGHVADIIWWVGWGVQHRDPRIMHCVDRMRDILQSTLKFASSSLHGSPPHSLPSHTIPLPPFLCGTNSSDARQVQISFHPNQLFLTHPPAPCQMAMPTEIADSPDRAPEVPVADGPVTFEAGVSEIADPRHPMEDAWFVGEVMTPSLFIPRHLFGIGLCGGPCWLGMLHGVENQKARREQEQKARTKNKKQEKRS